MPPKASHGRARRTGLNPAAAGADAAAPNAPRGPTAGLATLPKCQSMAVTRASMTHAMDGAIEARKSGIPAGAAGLRLAFQRLIARNPGARG